MYPRPRKPSGKEVSEHTSRGENKSDQERQLFEQRDTERRFSLHNYIMYEFSSTSEIKSPISAQVDAVASRN